MFVDTTLCLQLLALNLQSYLRRHLIAEQVGELVDPHITAGHQVRHLEHGTIPNVFERTPLPIAPDIRLDIWPDNQVFFTCGRKQSSPISSWMSWMIQSFWITTQFPAGYRIWQAGYPVIKT